MRIEFVSSIRTLHLHIGIKINGLCHMQFANERNESITMATKDRTTAKVEEPVRRLWCLAQLFNSLSEPVPSSVVFSNPDLGYDSPVADSNEKKFKRDREELRKHGIVIRDKQVAGANKTEKHLWYLDRETSFTDETKTILDSYTAETLLACIDSALEDKNSPFTVPYHRIQEKLLALAASDHAATSPITRAGENQNAVWTAFSQRKKLVLDYQNAKGERKQHTVAIWGIFYGGGSYYFVGQVDPGKDDGDTPRKKTFRVDRIQRVRKLTGTYAIPSDFRVQDSRFFTFDLGEGDPIDVTYEFPATVSDAEIRTVTHKRGRIRRDDEHNRALWTISARSLEESITFMLDHIDMHISPVAPTELVHVWNDMLDKAVKPYDC